MKHFINLFSRRLLLFTFFVALGLTASARAITNDSLKISGTGIDEHGVYVEFYVPYYDDDGDDNELQYSIWKMQYNSTWYTLFETSLSHQDGNSQYFSYFEAHAYPMYIRPNDSSGRQYHIAGSDYYGGIWTSGSNISYNSVYKVQKVYCTCDHLADAYVRVYLPVKFWGTQPTFYVTTEWDSGGKDGTKCLGSTKLSDPAYNKANPFLTYEPSSNTGKMNVIMHFTGNLNSNYAYTPTATGMTLTDKSLLDKVNGEFDKKFVAEYPASNEASTGSLSVVCTQATKTTYNETLFIYRSEAGSNASYKANISFPISHSYTWTCNTDLGACTYAKDLKLGTDQLKKSIKLTWSKYENNGITDGTFYIYRYNVSSDGKLSNEKVIKEKHSFTNTTYTDTDEALVYDQKYRYVVFFVANKWTNVNAPITSLADSAEVTITRSFDINLSTEPVDNKIELTWTYDATPSATTYNIYRKQGNNSYVLIGTTTVTSTNSGSATYTDSELVSGAKYTYKVEATVMNKLFTSNEAVGSLADMSKVNTLTASKGEYSNLVRLTWSVNRKGSGNVQYVVKRKLINSSDEYTRIHVLESSSQQFSYDDATVLPGQYYSYKVEAWPSGLDDNGNTVYETCSNSITDEGFCTAKGIVSGRITYGTGTAVPDAKVILTADNSDNGSAQFHSMWVKDYNGGIDLPLTTSLRSMFAKGPFSVELWVQPDDNIKKPQSSDLAANPYIFSLDDDFGIAKNQCQDMNDALFVLLPNDNKLHKTELTISPNHFTHITLSYDGSSTWKVSVIDGDGVKSQSFSCGAPSISDDTDYLNFGSDAKGSADGAFTGYLDEIRVWSKCLTDQEILKYANHTLSGSETGLKVYLPMDEGITDQKTVYDYSKTGGVANGNHAKVEDKYTTFSNVNPTEDQLSLHAVTDEQGNYTVMGVPFAGEGTSYTVRPTLGVHEFSPQYLNRFINGNSLTHNGVDFEDVSSFTVWGEIKYENTDYPVEGCNVYVDGTICAQDGTPVETLEDGTFTISVPIGAHYLTVKKSGHEFANDGRYPAGVGITHEFTKDIGKGQPLTFTDKTLVNFTGRVAGGDIEYDKVLGFGLSNNNIGITEIVITPTASNYYLNWDNELDSIGKTELACESATKNISSKSWRGTGNNAKDIIIHTDSLTGEFSVMVPPIQYKVTNMTVKSNSGGINFTNLPGLIDLTNPLDTSTDTLDADNYYEYHYALKPEYHSAPVFKVQQSEPAIGGFGIENYDLWENDNKYEVPVFRNNKYEFNYPLFISGNPYTFNISGYEEYYNYDDKNNQKYDKVPLEGTIVTISNALSNSQKVFTESGTTTEGETVSAGDVYDLQDNELTLDSLGEATYTWTAGLPNISTPYTRNISMVYEIGDKKYDWKDGNGLDAIILGSLPTGNNFVTSGPDHLAMILRDPPGTNSSASWTKGTATSYSHSEGSCWSMDANVVFTTMLGVNITTVTGLGVMVMNNMESKDDLTTGTHIYTQGESADTYSVSLSSSKTISTKDTPEYVGAGGDVFIGTATNILFGEANNIGLHRDPDYGTYSLDRKTIMTAGQQFGTVFQYDQLYIENTLLPNLVKLRNSMLKYYGQNAADPVNNGKTLMYVSHLEENNPKFGLSNDDDEFGEDAVAPGNTDGPSYKIIKPKDMTGIDQLQDSVDWCNMQIKAWEGYLAQNEEEKVKAFEERDKYLENNLSFGTGSDVEFTYEKEESTGSTYEHTSGANVILGNTIGLAVNGVGLKVDVQTETGGYRHSQTEHLSTETATFSYTLSEDGDDDALTVDVFNYGGYSRIFRTRGGQTCGPYEGEVQTKYYKPGTVIMEATQQIEVPKIAAVPAEVINVPSGSSATFTLRLSNNSQIGEDVYYKLLMIDESDSLGAIIKIDGMPLTEGRLIKVPAGETVTKSLQLSQSNYSILSYEKIGIVLASQVQYDPTSTWDQIADTCWISAYFVPSASPVTMQLSNTLINTRSVTNANPDPVLNITFKDFNRNYDKQKAFRIQYRQSGDTDWSLLREYVLDQSNGLKGYQEYLDDVASVTYPFNMKSMDDGEYTFRVVSVCANGTNEEVTVNSDEITVIKDMKRPQVLGTPKPSTGILTQGDDIAITFNEDINQNLLTDSNFKVTAQLNEATIANDVAIRATGDQSAAATTDANINLSGKDFAMDMWVKYSTSGTFVSHGNGTKKFKVGVDNGGHLIINIDTLTYSSSQTIEKNKWCYLALNYQNVDTVAYLSAICANDASTTKLFSTKKVNQYTGNGHLSVLTDIMASLHDLTLWDEAVSLDILQSERYTTKKPSTDGLIGCWRFDEGQGLSAADKARNRNMTIAANNSWYMNVANKAVEFSADSCYVSLNTSDCPIPSTHDYALELWFNADSKQLTSNSGHPTVFSADSSLVLRFDSVGQMELLSGKHIMKLGSTKYMDNQWHNFALNVLRNGTATVYIDSKSVAQTNGDTIGILQSDAIVLGAKRTYSPTKGYTYSDFFKGAIDDVRIWDASMNATILKNSKDTRLAGTEEGLVAYYPFEKIAYDEGNQPYTETYLGDKTGKAADAKSTKTTYTDGPAQNPAKEMTGVGFNYVASERTIVINLTEDADLIEGTTVNVTVMNVQDMNGNSSESIKWIAYVNQNQLNWNESELSVKTLVGSTSEFTASVVNNSAVTEQWTISGMPSWMTADMTQGTLTALTSQKIHFTVSDAVGLGHHDVTLYLSGNNGINVPLQVEVIVTGDEPDWAVNYADYAENMTIFGQIWHKGALSENTGDKIAAFIDGECRGVASPVYYPRYDSYLTQLIIYGKTDSDSKFTIDFKIWNAAEGKVYPVVSCYNYGENESVSLNYKSNADYGTATAPFVWNAEDKIEETLALCKGWNWTSLYVDADNKSVSSMLKDINVNGNSVTGFDNFAQSNGTDWSGSMSSLNVGKMYMIYSVANDSLTMVGKEVDATAICDTIKGLWNWIGLNASYRIDVNQAFAGLAPEDGDIVKSQSAFAMYDGYEWVGSLTSLAPGMGYMYKSMADYEKYFYYPSYASVAGNVETKERQTPNSKWLDNAHQSPSAANVFDFNKSTYSNYPANMTIVARVMNGDEVLTDAQVGAFANGECREAQSVANGLVFLTIPGDKAEKLYFEVASGMTCYSLSQTAVFSANSHLGTLDDPYVLQISGATAIDDVDVDACDDTPTYNTAGLKVGEGYKGVIIKNGEKHLEKK